MEYRDKRKRRHSTALLDSEDDVQVNDTVGAIALDVNGHVAATVSTGGNQMKLPGRVGHVRLCSAQVVVCLTLTLS
jgi:isoaspartyl peptidase/L-asparaginase-like protein (Ntn-hydrolase superfamily)